MTKNKSGGVPREDRLTMEEGKIAFYNMEQIFNVLKDAKKEKQFMTETIGDNKLWLWKRKKVNPSKISLRKLCSKLGIDVEDFIHKKLKADIKYIINIEFEK